MTDDVLDQDKARRIFLKMAISQSYKSAINMIIEYLEEEGKKRPADIVDLREWFANLDDHGREQVRNVVRKTADGAVFCFLVMLDGLSGGNPIPDKPSDFAVFLQTYESDDLLWDGISNSHIRVNPLKGPEHLHDLFRDMLEDEFG
jgi:hypothetical protein